MRIYFIYSTDLKVTSEILQDVEISHNLQNVKLGTTRNTFKLDISLNYCIYKE